MSEFNESPLLVPFPMSSSSEDDGAEEDEKTNGSDGEAEENPRTEMAPDEANMAPESDEPAEQGTPEHNTQQRQRRWLTSPTLRTSSSMSESGGKTR